MAEALPVLIPKALTKGDTIAFVSPSARLNDVLPAPLSRGKTWLESIGYHVKIIFTPIPPQSRVGDSVRIRCDELHSAFRDSSIAAIICTIGGSHANEILPFLDYNLIRSHPKIFMGYSDTTFLHWAFGSRAGLRTFYGPSVLTDFADFPKPLQFTVDHFLHVVASAGDVVGPLPRSSTCSLDHNDFLTGKAASEKPRDLTSAPAWRWVRHGRATGHLYGGTIRCVMRLLGTPFAPRSWTNRILFLETAMGDSLGQPYTVDQFREHFVDLALASVLNDINGLVIGRGYKYDANMQDELAKVILDVCGLFSEHRSTDDKDFPILMNADFGHTSPFLTLPYGALASLDSERDEFAVLEPGVKG